ncbi:hypothetical protein MAR_003970 [Mya arenaria]|uniref:Fibronectin type-III domain-containing protein n=1 Tax=Mya arenaria TaxID=6604 RepID=A0ABY7EV90_MYAAR|nr:hypothetical protein MAR_003970 [Mya arenaria]
MHNKLLNPVTPAQFNLIPTDSVYEQNKGLLPVSGTTNVDGIIQFNLNWLRFDRFGFKGSDEQAVQNFTRQRTCKSLNMSDGDTFVFHVNAIDIVNNSLVRNRTVFIDRTIPNVNNIYLVKNGEHMLFVHDSTELSTMLLYFEAFDIHSGVQNVLWKLETSDRSLTLGDGAIGAVTLDSVTTDVDDFLIALPNKKLEEDATISDFLCRNLQRHSTTDFIFVPHDNFALSFECKEDISQIDDFYVGMSTSRGKQAMPDLVDFRSTNRRKKFIYRHAAIGSDEPFFIVIKAVNKASVAAYVTFGPMIIDETPPYATDKPSVTVKGDFIFVEWANSTFVDDEQKSPVDQIFIQFAHDYAGFQTKSVSDEVVIDRSPPAIGKLILNNQLLNNNTLIATFDIHVELVDFTDYESGIDGFEVYISTKPDTVDISSMRRFNENTFDISLRSSLFLEGVEYYIHAQAINRAGLSSAFSTAKFQVDRTPPEGGHIRNPE